MIQRYFVVWGAIALLIVAEPRATAEDAFRQQVMPFFTTYCVKCHNPERAEGDLDLTRFTSAATLGEHFRQWEHVLVFLRKGEMPPEKARQPTSDERTAILATIEKLLAEEARKLAGDPGVVLPRRLNSAEYNYTIRDLTGVDMRPAESFPVDPASGEGFNNTGEALVMSPQLFKKYYAAAQYVAEHVVLTPTGMRFAPYSTVTFADQMKYHEQAILRFYEEHGVVYETYLNALWLFRYRSSARRAVTIEDWAVEHKLSPRYLRTLWDTFKDSPTADGYFLGWLRQQWDALPLPTDVDNPVAPPVLQQSISTLAENIRRTSRMLCVKESPAIVSHAGNAPIQHIDRRQKSAAERDAFDPAFLVDRRRFQVEFRKLPGQPTITIHVQVANVSKKTEQSFVVLKDLNFSTRSANDYKPADKDNNVSLRDVLIQHAPDQWERLKPGVHPLGHAIEEGSVALSTSSSLEINIPTKAFGNRQEISFFVEAARDREHSPPGIIWFAISDRPFPVSSAAMEPFAVSANAGLLIDPHSPLADPFKKSCAALCKTFPNRFVYVDDTRGLSAGFHLIEGVFRDDVPLCKLVLSDNQNRELNRLWEELYFGTGLMEKMLRGFVFFERSERNFLKHADFDVFKEEDPDLVKDETLRRFEKVYLIRSDVKPDAPNLDQHPIRLFFTEIRQGLKLRREQLARARPIYLRQLLEFAEKAYRRPLTAEESMRLEQFFETTSQQPELGIEQAIKGCVTSILVSPHFCCRIDVPPAGDSVQPLSNFSLASRLSYFLWSSTPDTELMELAKAGKLTDEATLLNQTRRMLQDPKVSELALEFFGQWLRYRDFQSQESVDRRVFPAFNDELRQAMFEEPTRLVAYLIQNNLPVTDILYGDATLVNKSLADYYGWPYPAGDGEWRKVEGIQKHGRGGVLGMAVFLTANSQPQRTSPVKRGFWVVHKILGEHIPAPPNEVAPLPAKETETDGKTIRQLLALHTSAETCARCHRRFDPVGLSMEGFDPVGRSRSQDLAGRPVDNAVRLPSGEETRGVPQFLKHLKSTRNGDFISTLCRKFLGFALGRSVELSDHELLEKLQAELRKDDYRFRALFETIILSPQFRNQRCRNFTIARFQSEFQRD